VVYLPPHFAVLDPDRLHEVMIASPLGTLVTTGSDGLAANHIPFVFDPWGGEHGRLLAHVARNNQVWRDHDPEQDALVIFQSADAYITPTWYETKRATHEVVPTWNYAVVHVYGRIVVHDDEKWIRGQAGLLTKQMESGQPIPWKMGDAPQPYLTAMLGQIVGIEIPITRIIGKLKASQNRSDADAAGAIAGLRDSGDAGTLAMADIMASSRRSD
jgi:transcriptional regulator